MFKVPIMIGHIYKLTCLINGRSYIGYTKNPEVRRKRHLQRVTLLSGATPLYKAIRKYGWNNFSFEVIYCSTDARHCLDIMEAFFIKEYGTLVPGGYNLTTEGEGSFRKIVTSETRVKLSAAMKGKRPTQEVRERLSKAASVRGVPVEQMRQLHASNIGKKRSIETRRKMSKATVGQSPSSGYKAMLARAKTYQIVSPTGDEETVVSLRAWEKRMGVGRNVFSRQARLAPGLPFKKGCWEGWTIRELQISPLLQDE